jgi:hypothetical protein
VHGGLCVVAFGGGFMRLLSALCMGGSVHGGLCAVAFGLVLGCVRSEF